MRITPIKTAPSDPQRSANAIRQHLAERFSLREVGVLLTDSTTRPLRWGVTGVALAHSGFAALRDYVGQPDIFGRPLAMTKANIRDGLAAAAVLVMRIANRIAAAGLPDVVAMLTNGTAEPIWNLSDGLEHMLSEQ